jgi:serine/threonine-protein kinase
VGHDGDRHYIVMEYVDGQDLKTLVRQRGRLEVDESLDIATQIAAGVGHAHKAGVIHCDVKPQNVLVTQDGRVKVTDFGIARALSESGLTESETVWGSPLYFSPEQAAGDPPAPASDVYSIGIVMYEMLSGLPPFQAEKSAALALMHMREDPPPLAIRNPQVPPQLEWIIRKVLAKEPAARYRTAGQLAHVLGEYRSHGEQVTGWRPVEPPSDYAADSDVESEAPPASPPPPVPQKELDRLTWVLGAIALVAVVGLVLLWLGLVIPAYSGQQEPLPNPTSAPLLTRTPEPQLVSVPDVVGEPVDEARRMVERAGLRFVVQSERD